MASWFQRPMPACSRSASFRSAIWIRRRQAFSRSVSADCHGETLTLPFTVPARP